MRAIQTALSHMRRSPYQGLVALCMMTLVFFTLFVLALTLIGTQNILLSLESRPLVIAYLKDKTSPEAITALGAAMKEKSYVESVKIVSQEEALEMYKKQNQDDEVLLELLNADIFPASLEVSGREITALPLIRDELSKSEIVEEVKYQQDVIETLTKIIKNLRIGGMVVVLLFISIGFLFISVILSLRIALKRQEISTMRLLGASIGYIVMPYMMEGVMYGISGAVIGWILMLILVLYLTPQLIAFFGGAIFQFSLSAIFLGGSLISGILLGAILGMGASFIAVKRFIRD